MNTENLKNSGKAYMENKQKILGFENAKTTKGLKYNYQTAIIYMASHKQSGFNVCPKASKQCSNDCLFFSGYGGFEFTQKARVKKTIRYFKDRINFMNQLHHEIDLFIKRCKKNNLKPCLRLNGTSDISYESYKFDNGLNIFECFPDLQFYDYTKVDKRMSKYLRGKLPNNYHLTFSRDEDNEFKVIETLNNGGNVAVVFQKYLPKVYKGYKVINGDLTDLRFLDKKNVIVGLTHKKTKGRKQVINNDSFIIKQ
tara:strand:- start:38 stop:799 length:762 start_codon:yes stop_codon:yes gene_type:complete